MNEIDLNNAQLTEFTDLEIQLSNEISNYGAKCIQADRPWVFLRSIRLRYYSIRSAHLQAMRDNTRSAIISLLDEQAKLLSLRSVS